MEPCGGFLVELASFLDEMGLPLQKQDTRFFAARDGKVRGFED